MKKILYISNIQTPYRESFFEQLAKECDLTVLYERSRSANRDVSWSEDNNYKYRRGFLNGINIGNENAFHFDIIKYLLWDYDVIVLGCFNSPVQMFANIFLRIIRKPFFINLDGEIFISGKSLKDNIKKFFVNGGSCYLIAGERSKESLRSIIGDKQIIPYYFSSLFQKEIVEHKNQSKIEMGGGTAHQNGSVLVVGQYFPYKGLDVAVEAAKLLPSIQFKFVGMGNRTELFLKETKAEKCANIQAISFLSKTELEREYLACDLLVLPSRQECWGLVINEAASFGMPIVATYGCGAAVEFLFADYACFLAVPDNAEDLAKKIKAVLNMKHPEEYSKFLMKKSESYSIEKSVKCHVEAFYT